MEALLNRHFWVVKLLGLATATYLAASAVVTKVGTAYLLDVEEADAAEPPPVEELDMMPVGTSSSGRRATANRQQVMNEIRKRNPFCPTCTPQDIVVETGAVDAEGRPVGPVVSVGEMKSSLPLKLMATMEATEPQYSLATVLDTETGGTGLYGVGDVVRPGVVVTGIDRGIVHLRNSASLEYLQLGDMAPPPKVLAPPPGAEAKEEGDDSRAIPGMEEAINCPNENLCVVEREFVEKLLSNPVLLARQARVIPALKDGETQGFKFYGIRKDSLPRVLGIKNGDLVKSINGEELNSMDKAMTLYTKLRRASNLSVTVERKGETVTKEIQIK